MIDARVQFYEGLKKNEKQRPSKKKNDKRGTKTVLRRDRGGDGSSSLRSDETSIISRQSYISESDASSYGYSASSGLYSENTDENSESRLEERGIVVNASDLSQCWSTASLDSNEEEAFQEFTKKYDAKTAKTGIFFLGNDDEISLPSLGSTTQGGHETQMTKPGDDSTQASDRSENTEHLQSDAWICGLENSSDLPDDGSYGGLRNNEVLLAIKDTVSIDTREVEEDKRRKRQECSREQDEKEGTTQDKAASIVSWVHSWNEQSKEKDEKDEGGAEANPVKLEFLKWWNERKAEAENTEGEETQKVIEKAGIDILQWWNEKVETEDDKETQKLIENARRDLLTAPNLITESKIDLDGSKMRVLNGRVRSSSKTFKAAKTKIDLNGRVNRVKKKQINILVNDDTSVKSLLTAALKQSDSKIGLSNRTFKPMPEPEKESLLTFALKKAESKAEVAVPKRSSSRAIVAKPERNNDSQQFVPVSQSVSDDIQKVRDSYVESLYSADEQRPAQPDEDEFQDDVVFYSVWSASPNNSMASTRGSGTDIDQIMTPFMSSHDDEPSLQPTAALADIIEDDSCSSSIHLDTDDVSQGSDLPSTTAMAQEDDCASYFSSTQDNKCDTSDDNFFDSLSHSS